MDSEGAGASATGERERWHRALEPLLIDAGGALWRQHSDAVNQALFRRWLRDERRANLLKTDLYDEAMGEGLYAMLAAHASRVLGIDVASSVLAAASARHPGLLAVEGDARCLPFADGAFDIVVSNSTLDHFDTRDEIMAALSGIHRVLRHGGRLLLTMDNAANPAVALRNRLPRSLLRRIGLVPYPIGATAGPRRLRDMLRSAGFEIVDTVALLHCPRALTVALARRRQRCGSVAARRRFLERAMRWERLARWPTRYFSGYFVGIDARKP